MAAPSVPKLGSGFLTSGPLHSGQLFFLKKKKNLVPYAGGFKGKPRGKPLFLFGGGGVP